MLDPGTSSWSEQFQDAMTIGGEIDEVSGEEVRPPMSAYILHFLSIFWKVLFAVVPPTSYYGGWAAFWVAVMMIGLLTAVIGELAGMFGCSIGLEESITAITFVALGTSLPDTFASAQAAMAEEYADAAIGNVTGSNAVNVFLGLGLPWMLSSIYWYMQGDSDEFDSGTKGYYLPAGDLSFSVIIVSVITVAERLRSKTLWPTPALLCPWLAFFRALPFFPNDPPPNHPRAQFTSLAITALLALLIRNFYAEGALGGTESLRKPSALLFVGMWFTYVGLASAKIKQWI